MRRIPKVALLLSSLLLIFLFLGSVAVRSDSIGRIPTFADQTWKSLNGYTVIFADGWLKQPPWRKYLGMPMFPRGGNSFFREEYYVSYPSGYLLPYYFLLNATGLRADYRSASQMALVGQALTVALLFALVLASTSFLAWGDSLFFAFLAATSAIFLFPSLLWFDLWFPDMAVIPACAAWLWAESVASGKKRRMALLAAGGFVDWFFNLLIFVYAALVGFGKGWRDRIPAMAALLVPVCTALAVHLFFTHRLGAFMNLVNRAGERSSLIGPPDPVGPWGGILEQLRHQLGDPAWLLFPASAVGAFLFFVFSAQRTPGERRISRLALALCLSAALHILILRQHYGIHPYPYLRLVLVIGIVSFAWLPALALARLEGPWMGWLVRIGVAALFVWQMKFSWESYRGSFAIPDFESEDRIQICEFVRATVKQTDFLFSRDLPYWTYDSSPPSTTLTGSMVPVCLNQIYPAKSSRDVALVVLDTGLPPSEFFSRFRALYLALPHSEDPLVRGKQPLFRHSKAEIYELDLSELPVGIAQWEQAP